MVCQTMSKGCIALGRWAAMFPSEGAYVAACNACRLELLEGFRSVGLRDVRIWFEVCRSHCCLSYAVRHCLEVMCGCGRSSYFWVCIGVPLDRKTHGLLLPSFARAIGGMFGRPCSEAAPV